MSWIKNWFGTHHYKVLYQHRNEVEAQEFLDNLVQFLSLPMQAKILDAGCGKGRHSVYLAQKGFNVTGIDVVEENIEFAKQFENKNLHFIQHDMREPFPVGDFDLALNLFTSFGYFDSEDEDIAVIKNVCNSLDDEGIFVIDFFNAHKVVSNLVESEDLTIDGLNFKIRRSIKNKFVIKDIEVEEDGETYAYQERVQLLSLNDFTRYLEEMNFEIKNVFGNYALEGFDPAVSERLIIIANKEHKTIKLKT